VICRPRGDRPLRRAHHRPPGFDRHRIEETNRGPRVITSLPRAPLPSARNEQSRRLDLHHLSKRKWAPVELAHTAGRIRACAAIITAGIARLVISGYSERGDPSVRLERKFLAVNTQSNSANLGYNVISKYAGAGVDYICLDEPEVRLEALSSVCLFGHHRRHNTILSS